MRCALFHNSDPLNLKIKCWKPKRDLDDIEKSKNFRRRVRFATIREAAMDGKHNCSWQEIESTKHYIEAKIRDQDTSEGTSGAKQRRDFRKLNRFMNQNQKHRENDDIR